MQTNLQPSFFLNIKFQSKYGYAQATGAVSTTGITITERCCLSARTMEKLSLQTYMIDKCKGKAGAYWKRRMTVVTSYMWTYFQLLM